MLSLSENQGKAEAVRFGMNHGITKGLPYLGFWDADLSTPLNEVQHFLHKLKRNPNLQAILGSRVRMLGTNIQRRALRHFVGRFYATLISIVLQLPIYDSQCGAKLFKVNSVFKRTMAKKFKSRWLFDVEMLARFQILTSTTSIDIIEYPLNQWIDTSGSKVTFTEGLVSLFDLIRIKIGLIQKINTNNK